MKVLITGGTGYVGSRLREYVRSQGHEVRLLVRPGSEHKIVSTDAYEVVRGDIFNTNACLRACDGCEAVVHLVGIIRELPSSGIVYDQFHRVATMNIVDAARRSGVERLLHVSALGAREDSRSAYYRTKYAGEQYVRSSPLRWTIFRPSWILGGGDRATRDIGNLVRKPIVPLINGGQTLLQPIALEDVCTCISKSLRMPETQQASYDLGGPDRVTLREIVDGIADQLGVRAKTVSVPAWAIKPVVAVLERFPSFPVTLDQMRMLGEDSICEVDRYVKTFRVEPKPFRQILPTLFRQHPVSKKTQVVL